MKKTLVFICFLLFTAANEVRAQTNKGVVELGVQIGSTNMTGKPSFMYDDGGLSTSLFFYKHHLFQKDWGFSWGANFQAIVSSSNIRFQETGGQTTVTTVPSSYQFNKITFGYINIPLLASYIPFKKDNNAVALRFGPSVGFLVNTSEKALVNNSPQQIAMASGRAVKADLVFEMSTLKLPGAKNREAVNAGLGFAYQLNNFTADPNGFAAFTAFFKLGFQF
jgi:hypothetical protein